MITLQKMNVVKMVDNEEAAARLKEKGFAVVEQGKVKPPNPAPAGKPPKVTNEGKAGAATFPCPHCDKVYKTQEGLDKHLAENHPNTGGEDDAADSGGTDNAGSNGQS